MIDGYKEFLAEKNVNSFWKIAKQLSLHEDSAVDKIVQYLTDDFGNLTTRNSIPLRYLGFIINEGNDSLKISEAGITFVRSPYKQKILDEQLMKIYLNCRDTGNRLKIDIIPLKVLLILIKKLKFIRFSEYELFICWVNNYSEIDSAEIFIKDMRDTAAEENYYLSLQEKIVELNIDDFSDHIKRFFDMLLISSYFHYDKETESINTNLSEKDIDVIVNTFDDTNFSQDSYYEYLTHNDGWRTYSDNAEEIKIIESLKKKTIVEKKEIARQIVDEKIIAVPLEDVKPVEIDLKISAHSHVASVKGIGKKKPFKIDFTARDIQNRDAGDRSEKIIVKYEKDKLVSMQYPALAKNVEQVSLVDDSLGYDIRSFNIDGSERHIEVKGVKNTPNTKFSFYISSSEMKIACDDDLYSMYIVFDYLSQRPMIFEMPDKILSGSNIPGVTITPKKFLVEIAIDRKSKDVNHSK